GRARVSKGAAVIRSSVQKNGVRIANSLANTSGKIATNHNNLLQGESMKTHTLFPRRKSLVVALAAAAASALPAQAPAQDADQQLEEITVTGSRIRMTDGMAAPTPVTVVTPAELNSFDP